MSDFTLNDTMAQFGYEVDEREIYNDIRSRINVISISTVVDADPTYAWYQYTVTRNIPAGWSYYYTFVRRHDSATDWQIVSHSATYQDADGNSLPYYDYSISELKDIFVNRDGVNWVQSKYVDIVNTGSEQMRLTVVVKYKYLATEKIEHEETSRERLTVRAVDSTSKDKYGRRVMNLTWTEGTSIDDMQGLVNYYLSRYKDPYARVRATLIGSTDALRTQIITREITDVITAVCTELGLNADFFLNAISFSDDHSGIPICTWELEEQRAEEALSLFTVGTSFVGGAHIIGP